MIKKIRLAGFKSFKDVTLDVCPLTVLTGLNSCGKSSFIQAILMAEKAWRGQDPLLDGHGEVKELINPYVGSLSIEVELDEGPIVIKNTEDTCGSNFSDGIVFPHLFYIEAGRYGSRNSVEMYIGSREIGSKGENLLKCIDYYMDCDIPEKLRHRDSEGSTFLFNLRAWLDVITPGVKFQYELQSLSDQSYSKFDDHRAANVGFGLSYTLPIIAIMLRASIEKGESLVLIENPEAHLHPKGQTALGEFVALCADNGVNIIVETHSDHFFDGVRIYAKNHKGFSDKMITYWFELDKDKCTMVSDIEIDADGRFTRRTPHGFFDQFELDAMQLF